MQKTHASLLILFILQGCTVYYYDPKTGAEHVWGIGHMAMKATVPQDGHRAVVRRTDVFGLPQNLTPARRKKERESFVYPWSHKEKLCGIRFLGRSMTLAQEFLMQEK